MAAKAAAKAPAKAPPPHATQPLPVVLGTAVGLAALGFVLGAGGSFLQARTVFAGVRWPLGCVFVLVVLGAVALSAGMLTRSRLAVGTLAAGWVISVLVFTAGRPEGDVIIAADLAGYLYLFGGVTVLAVVSSLPFATLPTPAASTDPKSPPA
ncbi:DUF6113 family protein [Sporichthya brevicatena]|uniref:DUF6113 family protein n=1 Tax=Sporichthya brevicatena TaxID=171442 RepID=UPI0031D8450E